MAHGISSTLLARLLSDAQNSPNAEICGLLLGSKGLIEEARPCRNVAPDPARAFEIDPVQLFAAHRQARDGGAQVIGHYHSHPSGAAVPSARDAAQAMGDGALWLILTADAARLWRSVRIGAFEAVALVSQDK